MKQIYMKKNQTCHCLYVNLTTNYVSFKIEEGKFLGKLKNNVVGDDYYVIEHKDDEVNYLKMEDIHATEKDAYKALIKILQNKVKK